MQIDSIINQIYDLFTFSLNDKTFSLIENIGNVMQNLARRIAYFFINLK